MGALLLVGIGLVIVVLLATAVYTVDEDDYICESDVPCQECGKCYSDHPGSAFSNHSYTYPRDF